MKTQATELGMSVQDGYMELWEDKGAVCKNVINLVELSEYILFPQKTFAHYSHKRIHHQVVTQPT